MKQRYGYCQCHNRLSSLNAKDLCPEGAKNRRKHSAESKGIVQHDSTSKDIKAKELLLFKKIYNERPPYCEWCKTPIEVFHIINYHHLKTKGAHPELRLEESNIVKICAQCHIKEHSFKPEH